MTQQKRHCAGDAGLPKAQFCEVLAVTPNSVGRLGFSQDRAERKSIGVVENTVDWLVGGRNIEGFPGRIQCG